MIRIVLDTNVLVSAVLQPKGPPAQILVNSISSATVQMCISGEIFAEYEEVLRRPRFKRSDEEIDSVLNAIRNSALWVRPSRRIRACSDSDDDVFLECAEAAQAGYVVTGNTKHFPAKYGQVTVVTPVQLLEFLREIQTEI